MSIFRSAGDCSGFTSVLKFGTHGMGHGHFDQLGLRIYRAPHEFTNPRIGFSHYDRDGAYC